MSINNTKNVILVYVSKQKLQEKVTIPEIGVLSPLNAKTRAMKF